MQIDTMESEGGYCQRWFVTGEPFACAEIEHEVLVSPGGFEKLMAVGFGKTNWF